MATESSRLSNSFVNRVKFRKLNTSRYYNNLGSCLDTFVGMFFLRWMHVSHFKQNPKSESHIGKDSSSAP